MKKKRSFRKNSSLFFSLLSLLSLCILSGCELERTCEDWQYRDPNGHCREKDADNCFRGLIYNPNDNSMAGTVDGKKCLLSEGSTSMKCVIDTDTSSLSYGNAFCLANSCDIFHYLDHGVCKLKDKDHCATGYELDKMVSCQYTSGVEDMECAIDETDTESHGNATCRAIKCDNYHYLDNGVCKMKDASHCGVENDIESLINCGEGASGCLNGKCICKSDYYLENDVCVPKDAEHCGFDGSTNCNDRKSIGVTSMKCSNSECVVESCSSDNYELTGSGLTASCACNKESYRDASTGKCFTRDAEHCGYDGKLDCTNPKPFGASNMECSENYECIVNSCLNDSYEKVGSDQSAVCRCRQTSYNNEATNECLPKNHEMCGLGNDINNMMACHANEKCDLSENTATTGTCILTPADERCDQPFCHVAENCEERVIDGKVFLCDHDSCLQTDPEFYSIKTFDDGTPSECYYNGIVRRKMFLQKQSDDTYTYQCSVGTNLTPIDQMLNSVAVMLDFCGYKNNYVVCSTENMMSFIKKHRVDMFKMAFWYIISHSEPSFGDNDHNILEDLDITILNLMNAQEMEQLCQSIGICGNKDVLYYCLADEIRFMLNSLGSVSKLTSNPIYASFVTNEMLHKVTMFFISMLNVEICSEDSPADSNCLRLCSESNKDALENYRENKCFSFTLDMTSYITTHLDDIIDNIFVNISRYKTYNTTTTPTP